jgi:hypothetical protein
MSRQLMVMTNLYTVALDDARDLRMRERIEAALVH